MPGPVVVKDLSEAEAAQLKVIFEGEGASVTLVPSDSGTFTLVATYPKKSDPPSDTDPGDTPKTSTGSQSTLSGSSGGVEIDPSGFRGNVLKTASAEWEFFGEQMYDVKGHPTQRGHKEQEEGFYQRIGTYWLDGTGTHGVTGLNTGMPWSAAFISWVMKTSRAGDRFRYSTLHAVYIYQAIRDRLSSRVDAGYWGCRLNEQKPAVGDIVCWGREPGVDYDHQMDGNYHGHSDVVVSVEANQIWVIGGNVGDSVTKRPLPLDADGHLFPIVVNGENLFALMQCRIGAPVGGVTGPTPPRDTGSSTTTTSPPSAGETQVAWGKVLDPELKTKIIAVGQRLGCDPSHLTSAMAFETGETFSPSKQNMISGAIGLIQFIPSTARSLGTTTNELAGMTAVRQMDYVAKYFEPYVGKLRGLSDVYMAILWPAAVGQPDSRTLFSKGTTAYAQNSGLDVNSDGIITKGEAASKVQKMLDKGLGSSLIG